MAKTLTLGDMVKTGMKIKVGEQDEIFNVTKVDTLSNQAWLQFGRSKAPKGTWNNISNVCSDLVDSLDTGVARELLDIGYGKAFVPSKDETTETGQDHLMASGIVPMGNAWTRTEITSKEAYYVGTIDRTFEVGVKTEEHLIMPVIILPASLEVVYCDDYYYRLVCRTDIGGNTIISIDIPSVVGESFMYNGSPQKPELTYDDKNVTVILPSDYTNVGRYMGIFRLKDKTKTQWNYGGTGDVTFIWEITGIPVMAGEISQKGVLTYNGKEQTPRWNNYDSDKMTIKGYTSGTSAGIYEVFFFLKPGYTWSDGTTSPRKVKWEIQTKHISTPTLSFKYRTYNGKPQEPIIDYHGYEDVIKTTKNYNSAPTDSGDYNIKFDLIQQLPQESLTMDVEE